MWRSADHQAANFEGMRCIVSAASNYQRIGWPYEIVGNLEILLQ